jgi:hypothetical protein
MKVEWNEGYEKGYADAMQAKTLTDEEILKVIDKLWNRGIGGHDKEWVSRMNNFARAILRKAQE